MSKRSELIRSIFNPDSLGLSDWVKVQDVIAGGLPWTKNGNVRRGIPFGDKDYLWEFKRKYPNSKSEVLEIRTAGHRKNPVLTNIIRKDIAVSLFEKGICNLSLLPVPKADREIDHRFGYKEHPKYAYLNQTDLQNIEDFQLLHHAQNVQKRQMCKKCVETGTRPKHPYKDFAIGNEKLDDEIVCEGCYLAQPELYR